MNAKHRQTADGTGRNSDGPTCEFDIAILGGRGHDVGEVYWPFARHQWANETWVVTHLPSGYRVAGGLSYAAALRLIKELRRLPVDWSFTKPKGKKWEQCKAASLPLVQAYRAKGKA